MVSVRSRNCPPGIPPHPFDSDPHASLKFRVPCVLPPGDLVAGGRSLVPRAAAGVCASPRPRAALGRRGRGQGSARRLVVLAASPLLRAPASRTLRVLSCARAALLSARRVLQPRLPSVGDRRGLCLGGPSLGMPCLSFPCSVAALPASPAARPRSVGASLSGPAGGRRAVWCFRACPRLPPPVWQPAPVPCHLELRS